jgi:ABC-2 type transport system permease protein
MIALCIVGLVKFAMTIALTSGVAYFLYRVNFFELGFALIPFTIILLLMSWAFGFLTSGVFLRHGTNMQTLLGQVFILMPLYFIRWNIYNWVQAIALWVPSTIFFEGM